jgi:hypothetical protein
MAGSETSIERKPDWTAPQLVELRLSMGNVEAGYSIGTDGSDPGPPFTSDS